MRTPKRLYAEERIIYHPEWLTCLHCGDLLVPWNYLAWDKTVQTLDGLLSIATRPGRCPHATCPGSRMRLLSAAAQRMAPPGSTYGYDVLVRIGWLRQHQHATYREMHTELSCRFPVSASHVRYLYQHIYLPLLTCHERQQRGRLAQVAQEQGGLVVALDGLAPQEGEPQIWFMRDLSTGLTLRSGWLAQLDQPTFEAFLAPLRHLEWPILAVLSDKQTGLVPAVATALPGSRHQLCQAHYLRNLAEPLAAADAAFKGALRQTVRQQVGDLIEETQVDYSIPWAQKMLNRIWEAYRRAPYFEIYFSELDDLLMKSAASISDLNLRLIKWVCCHLEIDTPIKMSREYHPQDAKTERLIGILQQVKATTYLSGPSAQSYLIPESFEQAGIGLEYKQYNYHEYEQLYPPFDFPIGGFSPPEGRLARGFKPPAFSRFLFQSAVKSAESF